MSLQGSSFEVRGIPAGRTFTVKNVNASAPAGCKVFTNAGGVYFEDVTTTSLHVSGSAQVSLVRVDVWGTPALRVWAGSHVVATQCTFSGNGAHAVEVLGARLTFTFGALRGGDSTAVGSPPYEALRMDTTSSVTLAGDDTTTVSCGLGYYPSSAPAVVTTGGTLTLDPRVHLIAFGGAQRIAGPALLTLRDVPALQATGMWPGNYVTAEALARPGDLAVVLVSVPGAPLPAPPFGEVWLDVPGIFFATGAVVGATSRFALALATDPGLPLGKALCLQAVSGPGLDLRLSNPVVVLLH